MNTSDPFPSLGVLKHWVCKSMPFPHVRVQQIPGLPEYLMLLPNQRCIWVDVMWGAGEFTEQQQRWRARLQADGQRVITVSCAADGTNCNVDGHGVLRNRLLYALRRAAGELKCSEDKRSERAYRLLDEELPPQGSALDPDALRCKPVDGAAGSAERP